MRAALLKGRWPRVADEINRYWQVKRELFPGSTTPAVDVMLIDFRGHYQAAGLAGAGGGGFAYFFCRDGRQARGLAELLRERSNRPGSLGAVYASRVSRGGLVVHSGPVAQNPIKRRPRKG
jgi:galactokinase/mevalonate kinase-like predicted kinase